MTSQPDFYRYLESAKQAELASALQAEGFEVVSDALLGDSRVDLLATKGSERRAFEILTAHSAEKRNRLTEMREAAKREGVDLRIIYAIPPQTTRIEIERLEQKLTDYVAEETFSELDSLSTHTRVEGVSDIDITDVEITSAGTTVKGTGSVDVELTYGGGEDEVTSSDSYPIEFEVLLNAQTEIERVLAFEIDTTSSNE